MPVIQDPTPDLLKSGNESVMDSPVTRAIRLLAQLVGANDPASQAMGMVAPLTVTMAGKALRPALDEAVRNTRGAVLENENLTLDLLRRQLYEQGGMPSVREGTFWLPSLDDPYRATYTGRSGYGGPMTVKARKTFENSLVAKAGTGGNAPKEAFDHIMGKGAYDAMRNDVLDAVSRWSGPVDIGKIKAVLSRHGGNPDLADYIVSVSKKGNQLPYAIQENIVANVLRGKGYDSVVGYTIGRTTKQPRLSEVFDLTEEAANYPWK